MLQKIWLSSFRPSVPGRNDLSLISIPMKSQTNYARFPVNIGQNWSGGDEGLKKKKKWRKHLIILWMGEKEKLRRLVARQHTLQLLVWDLDYENYLLCPHMCLPSCWESSGSSDYFIYDISISMLICSVLAKAHFKASLIPKMLQSFCPCNGHYMVYMQTASVNGSHMHIEPFSEVLGSSPVSWQLGTPADTKPWHCIHLCTKLDFGSSLARNHKMQRLEEPRETLTSPLTTLNPP